MSSSQTIHEKCCHYLFILTKKYKNNISVEKFHFNLKKQISKHDFRDFRDFSVISVISGFLHCRDFRDFSVISVILAILDCRYFRDFSVIYRGTET